MQYRYAFRVDRDFPQGRYVDLASESGIEHLRSRCLADVREMERAKMEAVHDAFFDRDRQQFAALHFAWLVDKSTKGSLSGQEAAWLDTFRATLGRVWAIHRAAEEIDAEIRALLAVEDLYDHSAGLPTNPIWPE